MTGASYALSHGNEWLKRAALLAFLFGPSIVFTLGTLGKESLWIDELLTIAFSEPHRTFLETLDIMWGETNPPLYYLLMKQWRALFGTDAVIIRMLGAVFYYAFGVITYFYVEKHFGRRYAAFYIFFYLFSYFPLKYAQEARAYILIFSTTSFLIPYSVVGLNNGVTLRSALILTTLVLVNSYLHFFGALISFSVLVVLFIYLYLSARRRELLLIGAASALASIAYVPFVVFLFMNMSSEYGAFTVLKNQPSDFVVAAYYTFSRSIGCAIVLLLLVVATYTLRLFTIRGLKAVAKPVVLLPVAYCALGVVVAVAISLRQPVINWRYLIVFAPCAYFVLAFLLTKLDRQFYASLVALLIAYAINACVTVYNSPKNDWRAAGAFLRSYIAATGCVVPSKDLTRMRSNWQELFRTAYGYYLGDMASFIEHKGPRKVDGCHVIYFAGLEIPEELRAYLEESGISDYSLLNFMEVYVVVRDESG